MQDRWLILADDLTGATDSGAQFASRGIDTLVSWGDSKSAGETPVVAWDLATRQLEPAAAAAKHEAAVRRLLAPGRRLYKKIDSTLRGQPAAEIAALHATLRELSRPAQGIFAPANPATTLPSLPIRRTLRAFGFITVLPIETWPSPAITVEPFFLTPTMVVPCHWTSPWLEELSLMPRDMGWRAAASS